MRKRRLARSCTVYHVPMSEDDRVVMAQDQERQAAASRAMVGLTDLVSEARLYLRLSRWRVEKR